MSNADQSEESISPSRWVQNLLCGVFLQNQEIPHGYAGMTDIEVRFYNYYIANRLQDRSFVRSQVGQDLWVAFLLDCWNDAKPGFFVEFGGHDGETFSNTYLLEKKFGWRGVIAEPNPGMLDQIRSRRSCGLDGRCVWSSNGRVSFNTVSGGEDFATVDGFGSDDRYASMRLENRKVIEVEAVSLSGLLDHWDCPAVVDFLSVDTEGSEYEILRAFDFSSRLFRVLSVEHNWTPNRDEVFRLMERNGYRLVPRSMNLLEDMYVRPELLRPDLFGVGGPTAS